jgi:hypothetical protein
MGMEISVDKDAKILKVKVDGFPTPENAQGVLNNYHQIVSGVNAKENSLLIDCTELGVFQQESIAILEKLLKLYMEVGFKNIVFIKSKKSIRQADIWPIRG